MQAAAIDKYGPPELIYTSEFPFPSLSKKKQVLVRVKASSVNPVDTRIRSGKLNTFTGKKFPKILGADFSGTVEATNSSRFNIGDDVFGFVNPLAGGACAEYMVVHENDMALKPKNVNHQEAGVLPLVGVTAIQALQDKLRVKPGGRILINGCVGGVGSIAVQIAKAKGLTIIGTCSTKNVPFAESLGVDEVVDYSLQDIYNYGYFDYVFDTIGNLMYGRMKPSLQKKGKFLTVAFFPGLLLASLFAAGKLQFIVVKPDQKDLMILRDYIESQQVKPVINCVYPLTQLSEAHTYSETKRVVGKISITT